LIWAKQKLVLPVLDKEFIMKSIKFEFAAPGAVFLGMILMSAPAFSDSGMDRFAHDNHGWDITEAGASQGYLGTSLRTDGNDGLGFVDPKAGDSDYSVGGYVGTSLRSDADGELGFTDPRAGE